MSGIKHHIRNYFSFQGTIVFLLFFVVLIFSAESQTRKSNPAVKASSGKSEKAIRAFNNMAYPRAIRIFETLNEKGKLNNAEKSLLGMAWFRIDEPAKAAEIFASIGEDRLSGEFLYTYARVLHSLEHYKDADRVMARYHSQNPDDTRAHKQLNSYERVKQLKQTNRYKIRPLNLNSSFADFSPLLQNGILFFTSNRSIQSLIKRQTAQNNKPYLNVFMVVPQGEYFSTPEPYFSNFQTRYHDGPLCFNTTGTEVFITRNAFQQNGPDNYTRLKIVYSTRNNRGEWSDPVDLPFNVTGSSTGHPWLTADNNRLYFVSDRPGGSGGSDIWYINRTSGEWGIPVNAGAEINTEGNEMFPFVASDGKLYFASDGHPGMGGLDLFVSIRKGEKQIVKNMGYPINSEKDDFSIFLNPDGNTGFFASNRPGGLGDDDIYRFTVLNPITFDEDSPQNDQKQKQESSDLFKFRIIDQKTEDPVSGALVGILDSQGRYLGEETSDENGYFVLNDSTKGKINVMTAVEYYYPYEDTFTLNDKNETHYLMLRPLPTYGIFGQLTTANNGTPLSGVTITISSASQDTKTFTSDQEGKFRIRLNPYSSFRIEFSKKGYSSIQTEYSTINKERGYINLNQSISLKMKPGL